MNATVIKGFGIHWMHGFMRCSVDQYEDDYIMRMTGRHPGFHVCADSLKLLLEDLDGETCFEPRVKQNLRENLLQIIKETT